jgi:hypothetical protein
LVIISIASLINTCSERQNAKEAAISARKAQKDAEKLRKEAIQKAEDLVQSLEEKTASTLDKLEATTKIADLLTDAEYNIDSLIELEKIGYDSNYPFYNLRLRAQKEAVRIRFNISREYALYFENRWSAMLDEKNVNFHYFSTKGWEYDEFFNKYKVLHYEYKAQYIKFVSNKKKLLSEQEIFSFLHYVLTTEKLPVAIYMASSIVEEYAHLQKGYLSGKVDYIEWLKDKLNIE